MIVYNRYEYEIRTFERDDRIELFEYFLKNRVQNKEDSSRYSMKRQSLKMEVKEAINANNHTPIGIYKNNELIGVCLTFVNKKMPQMPELKYMHIKKEYIDSMATYMVFNFIINILYKDESIKIRNGRLKEFGSITRELPKVVGFSIFNNTFINNLNKYFKDD